MKARILLIVLVWSVQSGCSNDDQHVSLFKDDASINTLNGTWKVISFEDYALNTTDYPTQENSWDKNIVVTFDDTAEPNQLSGKVTTNTVAGVFEYTGTRQFKMNNYGSTYIAQPEWADKFAVALLDDDITYQINKTRLRIYYANKSKSVSLIKD